MPEWRGRSLGDAVHAMLEVAAPTSRGWRSELRYITGKTTGASRESVARQLGVKPATLRSWLDKGITPTKASRAEIERVFKRFWGINTKAGAGPSPGTAVLTVKGDITVKDKPRKSIICEPGPIPRKWKTLRTATVAQINKDYGSLFIDAVDPGIPYLKFHSGPFTISIL